MANRTPLFALAAAAAALMASPAAAQSAHLEHQFLRVGIVLRPPALAVELQPVGTRCTLTADGQLTLARAATGQTVRILADGARVVARMPSGAALHANHWLALSPEANGLIAVRGRRYPGQIRAYVRRGAIQLVAYIPLEAYVEGVARAETPAGWPPQAVAAQAVVARSFALASIGRHARDGYDLCNVSHCQQFRGAEQIDPATRRAVAATRGWILTWHGRPALALFSSCCGGRTASPWPGAESIGLGYLRSVTDTISARPACSASPDAHWSTLITRAEMLAVLKEAGWLGSAPPEIRVTARDPSGRVSRIRAGSQTIPGSEFWIAAGRVLGRRRIRSPWFALAPSGTGYAVSGRGYGHGLGLCQWGARALALEGMDWRAILRRYYPGLHLERLESGQ